MRVTPNLMAWFRNFADSLVDRFIPIRGNNIRVRHMILINVISLIFIDVNFVPLIVFRRGKERLYSMPGKVFSIFVKCVNRLNKSSLIFFVILQHVAYRPHQHLLCTPSYRIRL